MLVEERDERRKPVANPPPDGGWGWMVVFASFMIHVIGERFIFVNLYVSHMLNVCLAVYMLTIISMLTSVATCQMLLMMVLGV